MIIFKIGTSLVCRRLKLVLWNRGRDEVKADGRAG